MDDAVFSLAQKRILVTGSSSGIGQQIALTCGSNGAKVCITGRDVERLQAVYASLPADDHIQWAGDLADFDKLDELVDALSPLDGVVLNAGMVKTQPVQFIKSEDLDRIFDVNIKSTIVLIQKLLKKKKINKGASIVFISSISTQKATVGNAMYNATKGAVNSYAKSLALELAPKGIRVNVVLPGFVPTNILEGGHLSAEELAQHEKNYPIGRFGHPRDIALLVQYLLSDASAWMTGSLIPIDGGFSLK